MRGWFRHQHSDPGIDNRHSISQHARINIASLRIALGAFISADHLDYEKGAIEGMVSFLDEVSELEAAITGETADRAVGRREG